MSNGYSAVISALNLGKTYYRGRQEVSALRDITFSVDAGERIGLLGRSGSGKTTLLNLLAGLDQASGGKLVVDKTELTSCTKSQTDRYRRKSVGVVFQQFRLIQHRTAAQNVELPLMIAGVAAPERRQRVEECLELVGLEHRADHKPAELSGGEQQRVAVARAVVHQPRILLADEPTGNLDSQNARQVMDLISEVAHLHSITVVLVTHDESLATRYAKRVIRIADGTMVSDQPVAEDDCPSDAARSFGGTQ